MKQLTAEEKRNLDRVKKMIWKNTVLMLKWTDLPDDDKEKKLGYISSLIKRTEMLVKAVKLLEEME